jgi:hypothetical protein
MTMWKITISDTGREGKLLWTGNLGRKMGGRKMGTRKRLKIFRFFLFLYFCLPFFCLILPKSIGLSDDVYSSEAEVA